MRHGKENYLCSPYFLCLDLAVHPPHRPLWLHSVFVFGERDNMRANDAPTASGSCGWQLLLHGWLRAGSAGGNHKPIKEASLW